MNIESNIKCFPKLNKEEFVTAITYFFKRSQSFGEDWELQGENMDIYLCKRNVFHQLKSKEINKSWFRVDYHITYSISYQVPTLLFIAYWPDNTLLSQNEIYNKMKESIDHPHIDLIKEVSFNGGISQQDHPILNVPYYMLHPCETSTLLTNLFTPLTEDITYSKQTLTLKNYISIWLSLIGAPLGLYLNIKYFIDEYDK